MADPALNIDVTDPSATTIAALRRLLWKTGDDSGLSGKFLEWKDAVDEIVLQLLPILAGETTVSLADVTVASLDLDSGDPIDESDFTIAAAWGSGATLNATPDGTSSRFTLSITAGSTPSANPQLRLNFPTARATAPRFAIVARTFDSHAAVGEWQFEGATPALLNLRFKGTPVEDDTYGLTCILIG